MKCVIIEDDEWCATSLVKALSGFYCSEPQITGKLIDAYEMLDESTELVWLDLGLTDSKPEETIAIGIPTIRSLAPNAAIVSASGYGDFYRERALSAGADAYANKSDLTHFDRARVSALILAGAQGALARGVDARQILERVSKVFQP